MQHHRLNKSANCFKLGISASAVACIRAHQAMYLRRPHLRHHLDVDFVGSRLHAKLTHYTLMIYVSDVFLGFVEQLRDSDVDVEGHQ